MKNYVPLFADNSLGIYPVLDIFPTLSEFQSKKMIFVSNIITFPCHAT